MFDKIPAYLKNRFVVTFAILFIWWLFGDQNSMINQIRLGSTLRGLEKQKEFYVNGIREDSIALQKLIYDTSSLEKYARETFLMKRENEDIYLIVEEK
jgi:hypothetical protein